MTVGCPRLRLLCLFAASTHPLPCPPTDTNLPYARNHDNQCAGAADDFHKAIQLNTNNPDACGNLGWLPVACPIPALRNGKMSTKAWELTQWKRWEYLGTLAVAWAEPGDFQTASKYEQQILEMTEISDKDRVGVQNRLSLYQLQKPYHEMAQQD
jgi:hypothetical protein